jgi:type III pantothenate kinase
MLLAIEQGNTNSLFAIHDGAHWIAQWRTATEPTRTADEYVVWLSQLMAMQKLALDQLNACVISSVVPQSIFNLRNLSRRYLGAEPLIIGENTELGIPVRTLKPSEVGSDRLVNALGALAVYSPPLIIVDSGTAITLDVISADGPSKAGSLRPAYTCRWRPCTPPRRSFRGLHCSGPGAWSATIPSAPCSQVSFGGMSRSSRE